MTPAAPAGSPSGESDHDLVAMCASTAGEHIQWLIDTVDIIADRLAITGWALTIRGIPADARFLLDGVPFDETTYPLDSPDIAARFSMFPYAAASRFSCSTTIDWGRSFADGYARLTFQDGSSAAAAHARSWYLPDPRHALPMPDDARIRRVIGSPNATSFVLGGATIYKRLEHYLGQQLSLTFSDFRDVLDFGCGCGRVTRYFAAADRPTVTGVDIDPDNLEWCRRHIPQHRFLRTSFVPPLPFGGGSFDLVIAISVLSQMPAPQQEAWLQELTRIVRPGGLVMASVTGPSQCGLSGSAAETIRQVVQEGFVVTGRNADLDDVLPDQNYYVSGLHSRDFLNGVWGRHFTVVDIVDGLAGNDDLVLLRNDRRPRPESVRHDPEVRTARENPFSLPLRDYDLNPFVHPTCARDAYAGHLIDSAGIDYVDFMSAWGTNLLGYGYRPVARAVARQARRFNGLGMPYGEFNELAALVSKIIPSAEVVRYGKNGSDVCAGAVRLARAVTGRDTILYHGYHGFHDWYFASTDCPGVPRALKGTILPQHDLSPAAVDAAFRARPGDVAGIILNPLTGPIPSAEEVRETIDVVHSHGGIVIFDEMLSGFRVARAGMQELWGVSPDLSCFGKAIANGLPLAVLCGKAELMNRLPEIYYGMTFEGEAISIAAARATLDVLVKRDVIGAFYEKGRALRAAYERMSIRHGVRTWLAGFESCMHIEFEDQAGIPRRQLLWLMIQELVRRRVFTLGAFLLCFSHTGADLRRFERAADGAMSVVAAALGRGTTQGLLDDRILARMHEIRTPAQWRQSSSGEPEPS